LLFKNQSPLSLYPVVCEIGNFNRKINLTWSKIERL